jgi:hypothetical protein
MLMTSPGYSAFMAAHRSTVPALILLSPGRRRMRLAVAAEVASPMAICLPA